MPEKMNRLCGEGGAHSQLRRAASTLDTIDAFRAAMHEAGTPSPDVIEADGLLHRFHVEGDKRGTLNGWYCLHLDGRAAGIFGNWKTGIRQTWAANGRRLDEAEREAFAELVRAARAKAEAERRAGHEAQAIEARREWAVSDDTLN